MYKDSDLKVLISLSGPDFDQATDRYNIELYNGSDKLTFNQNNVELGSDGNYYLMVSKDRLHAGSLILVVTVILRDDDFPGGYREEKLRPVRLKPILEI